MPKEREIHDNLEQAAGSRTDRLEVTWVVELAERAQPSSSAKQVSGICRVFNVRHVGASANHRVDAAIEKRADRMQRAELGVGSNEMRVSSRHGTDLEAPREP